MDMPFLIGYPSIEDAGLLQTFWAILRLPATWFKIAHLPIQSNRSPQKKNASTAHIPVMFGVMRDGMPFTSCNRYLLTSQDGACVIRYPSAHITDKSSGLQYILGLSTSYAESVISSGLFPFTTLEILPWTHLMSVPVFTPMLDSAVSIKPPYMPQESATHFPVPTSTNSADA